MEILHIYTRVSTSAQEVDGTSLDTQQELGIKKAAELGFKYKVWNEGGQSSSKDDLANRPALVELLSQVEQGQVQHIFVFNTDRLSRNEQTWSVIRLRLVQFDVTLHTSSGVFNLTNPIDKMLLGIMSEVSAYDNSLRAERSRLGKLKRIKQGFWMGGPPPFGYKIESKKLVENPDESKWVKLIFERYSAKVSTRSIKQELLKNGVMTRRNNTVWSLGSIEKLLTNTHYGGFYRVTDNKTQDVMRVDCPAIISNSLIKKVSVERESRTRQTRVSESNQTHFYLLRDFLRCGQCGSRYSGRFYPSQYRSVYYCPRIERNYVNESTGKSVKCSNRRYLKIEATDSLVWDTVVEILSKSHLFKEELRKQVLGGSDTHMNQQQELIKLKRKTKKLELEIADTTNSIVNLETDQILKRRNISELSRIIKNVEKARIDLESERDDLYEKIHSIENQTKWVDWVSKFGDRINRMTEFSPEEKHSFLMGVVERITVQTLDTQTHKLDFRFKIPYVNDKLIWKNKSDKSKGYTLRNGESEISVEIDSPKKNPILTK